MLPSSPVAQPRSHSSCYFAQRVDQGEAWRDSVLICLQKLLVPRLTDSTATCASIRKDAFDSHPECYTLEGASICDLRSLSDVHAIMGVLEVRSAAAQR